MTVLRGILAVLAGTAAAAVAGVAANFGNTQFHWVEPAYGYMYFYPWLTVLGGLLGAGLSGALFALWNRSPEKAASPLRAVLASATGTLWAGIAGVVFDYANGYFSWLSPEVGFPYAYACLTLGGGIFGAIIAAACYRNWHLAAPAVSSGKGRVKPAANRAVSRAAAAAKGTADYTSARQQKSAGFADVPGMPLGDFQSALDTSKDTKAKE